MRVISLAATLLCFAIACTAVGTTSGCAGCTQTAALLAPSAEPAAPPASAPADTGPQPSPPPAAAPLLTRFGAVDISRLDAPAQAFFTKVANDEVCPCDCPKSFGQCLQEGSQCKPAVLLAQWLISELESGTPGEMLQEAITRELTGGFSAAPKPSAIKGFSAKGSSQPKFTIVEYADFECQHCKLAASAVDELMKTHPEVKVVYKHFPLSFHPMARAAAIAAEAAARQGKFWEMHAAIFATQELLSDDLLTGHAKALGLDVARFSKDIADPELAKKVDDSHAQGLALGVAATPAFFINDRPYFLARSVGGFELRFAMEDARASASCN